MRVGEKLTQLGWLVVEDDWDSIIVPKRDFVALIAIARAAENRRRRHASSCRWGTSGADVCTCGQQAMDDALDALTEETG